MKQRIAVVVICIVLISCNTLYAQSDTTRSKTDTSICINPEIEADYPGGVWNLYLHKHLAYPEEAENKHIEGLVRIQFIVEINGSISNLTIISGPKELQQEALRLCKHSGQWNAAVYNGKKVRARIIVPIEFAL